MYITHLSLLVKIGRVPLFLTAFVDATKGRTKVSWKGVSGFMYRDIFKTIDEFTALRFTATGASSAAKHANFAGD
jgi:hypothetical protein